MARLLLAEEEAQELRLARAGQKLKNTRYKEPEKRNHGARWLGDFWI